MKKVFIGGSRRISHLNEQLRKRLDQVIQKQLQVLVGDANGADKAVQAFLAEHGYRKVEIYCSAGNCRNNLGQWQVISVKPPHNRRDFEFFAAKDAAMAQEADAGFMLWDGQSAGTVVNVARLVAAGKPVVIYLATEKEFRTVRSRSNFDALLTPCSEETRQRINQYITSRAVADTQHTLF
jgi:adenine-specific DNA-methyltransferase